VAGFLIAGHIYKKFNTARYDFLMWGFVKFCYDCISSQHQFFGVFFFFLVSRMMQLQYAAIARNK